MKVLIAIPSYNRPYEIEKRCGFWLKKLIDIDWKVFVRQDQYKYYLQSIDQDHLVSIDVNSFRETINAIGQYARLHKYDLVHKIDDDMSFKKLGQSRKSECHLVYQHAYNQILTAFEDPKLYGLSIAKFKFHLRSKGQNFGRENKALYGNQVLRPIVMNLPTGIELFDDIFFTLEILRLGYKTLTYIGCYEDALMLINQGGLQSIDRNAVSKDTIAMIAEHYPEVKECHYKDQEHVVDINLKELGIK